MKTKRQIELRLEDALSFLQKQERLIRAYTTLFEDGEIDVETYTVKCNIGRRLISQTKDEIRTLEWVLS